MPVDRTSARLVCASYPARRPTSVRLGNVTLPSVFFSTRDKNSECIELFTSSADMSPVWLMAGQGFVQRHLGLGRAHDAETFKRFHVIWNKVCLSDGQVVKY